MDTQAGTNTVRILIVEDELLIAQGLARKLGKLGYAVTGTVTSGLEAIEQATQEHPDLVMMDIIIQGEMDGIAAAERIYRELDIPVVFVTAYADDETLQSAERAGAYGYVLKPYQEEEVNAAIRLAMRKHREVVQLNLEANTDPLTGGLNRRAWLHLAEREFQRWRRYGDIFSLIMLDIDRFKQINDTYGHGAGDIALATVAAALRDTLRKSDGVGRIGGDEFAILLPNTPIDDAGRLAERLRANVAALQLEAGGGSALQVTLSIGVAAPQPVEQTLQVVLERADQGLYHAKERGRNRVEIS